VLRGPDDEKKKQAPYQPVKVGSADDDFRRKKKRKRITKDKEVIPVKPETGDKKDKPGIAKKVLKKRPVRAEVDDEAVQKQIKETLARLTSKGKSRGSKYRREKRDAAGQRQRDEIELKELEKNIVKEVDHLKSARNVRRNHGLFLIRLLVGLFADQVAD
jgi:translation initiation factor IF-2